MDKRLSISKTYPKRILTLTINEPLPEAEKMQIEKIIRKAIRQVDVLSSTGSEITFAISFTDESSIKLYGGE